MPKVTEEYRQQKRKEIIDAAYRVCLRKPITSVEMKDVIAETGFSHGVVYRYYSDLDDILVDLVIRINTEHRIDDRVEKILAEAGSDYNSAVRKICLMLADYLEEIGPDLIRLTLYCDMLAMSDYDRFVKIGDKVAAAVPSPLAYVTQRLENYLNNFFHMHTCTPPTHDMRQVMLFFTMTYQGIQTAFVLDEQLKSHGRPGAVNTRLMFIELADAITLMLGRRG